MTAVRLTAKQWGALRDLTSRAWPDSDSHVEIEGPAPPGDAVVVRIHNAALKPRVFAISAEGRIL